MKKRKEKRKYVARPGIEPRTPDLRVRCPTDCEVTNCKRQTPCDQKVDIDACVSFSKRLQSQILYVRFSCKTPQDEGKLHSLHLFGKKTSKENGNQCVDYLPKRTVLLNKN